MKYENKGKNGTRDREQQTKGKQQILKQSSAKEENMQNNTKSGKRKHIIK